MSLVCYNVENLFDTIDDPRTHDNDFLPHGKLRWNTERYRHKLRQLAKSLSWTSQELPLLIGLVEVENRAVVEDLVGTSPLDRGKYIVVHEDSPDERGIDVALLVRPEYAQVLEHEALRVELPDGDRTRDVLQVRLQLAGGEHLHVFVVHWPSRGEGQEKSAPKRMAAARVVHRALERIRGEDPEAMVLVMGDLNDGPRDASVERGLKARCNGPADLTALMCSDRCNGRGSYNHQGEWAYLDQFLVDPVLRDRIGSVGAFQDRRLLFDHPRYGPSPDRTYAGTSYKGGFSDHLPIVLRLRWNAEHPERPKNGVPKEAE